MASEASILITIGAAAGSAIAGIGSVEAGIKRLGSAMDGIKRRKDAIGGDFVGPRTAEQLARANAEAVKLGRTLDQLKAKRAALIENKQVGEALRQQRQDLKGEALGLGAMALTLGTPVKLAIDFESAMAEVKKVVEFDTPDGLKKLGDELLRMTRTIPINATGLAAIAASGGQLGVAARDLPLFTETIAKMSVAFDMLPEDAGDSMAKLANVYQIPIAQIGRLGDAINQLSNESPAKASDIVRTLSRVGGVAKAFGLSELQAASLSNALISLGKAPEVAGTAINGMLTKLVTADKQGAKFQGALAQIGMSAGGLKKAIKQDAQGALVGFLQALEKVPADRRMGVLVDLFGLEYADDVAVLAGSVKTYTDSIKTLNKPGANGQPGFIGSMDKEFKARSDTTGNQLQLLKQNLSEVGVVIGSAVLPAINDLVRDIAPIIIGMADWAKANQGLVGSIMKGLAVLLAFKAGSLALSMGLNLVATFANSVSRTFLLLSGRFLWLQSTWLLKGPVIMARLGSAIGVAGRFAAAAWPMIVAFGKGIAMTFGGPIMLAGKALLFLGRALLLNPIGLAVTGIALAGYLIYKYWDRLKLLPGQALKWGADLIDGLVHGIVSRIGVVRDRIVGLGRSIKAWFTDTLGIRSPSRVFIGYGANIGEGAEQGILGRVARVKGAAARMAGAAVAGAALAGGPAGAAARGAHGAGMVIHYSPNITVQGGAAGEVVPAVQQALKLSEREFEQMLNRTLAQRQRRNF